MRIRGAIPRIAKDAAEAMAALALLASIFGIVSLILAAVALGSTETPRDNFPGYQQWALIAASLGMIGLVFSVVGRASSGEWPRRAVWLLALGFLFALIDATTMPRDLDPMVQKYRSWRAGNPHVKVWVNPTSGAYYCPEEKLYGKTIPGYYTSQAEARAAGYKTDHSFGCR